MRFNSELAALEYWEEAYCLSGGESIRYIEGRNTLFDQWVIAQDISWLDEEDEEFINSWDETCEL